MFSQNFSSKENWSWWRSLMLYSKATPGVCGFRLDWSINGCMSQSTQQQGRKHRSHGVTDNQADETQSHIDKQLPNALLNLEVVAEPESQFWKLSLRQQMLTFHHVRNRKNLDLVMHSPKRRTKTNQDSLKPSCHGRAWLLNTILTERLNATLIGAL